MSKGTLALKLINILGPGAVYVSSCKFTKLNLINIGGSNEIKHKTYIVITVKVRLIKNLCEVISPYNISYKPLLLNSI